MKDEITVVKASGEIEPFSSEKIEQSLKKAGVLDNALSRWVVDEIRKQIKKKKISTNEIYEKVFHILKEKQLTNALRYQLKKAILELGPSGHPFEKFVAKILKELGYDTQTNVILKGKCISHEVDVIAIKESKKIAIEAKYHNIQGIKTDVKIAMYVKARFEDIREVNDIDEMWLITNTKLTGEAKIYCSCSNIKAIAWNYPEDKSLQNMIEENKLYPITILNTLNYNEKQTLLENNIILVKEITPQIIENLKIKKEKRIQLQVEIEKIKNMQINF